MLNKITILFSIIFFSLTGMSSFSQSTEPKMNLKNEFHASYILGPVQPLSNFWGDIFNSFFTSTELTDKNPIGPIEIGYKRTFEKILNVGIKYSYLSYKTEAVKTESKKLYYTEDKTFHTIMFREDIVYVRNKWVQIYSGVGVGYSFLNGIRRFTDGTSPENLDDRKVAFQFNLIGLRAGYRFGGFFEFGFGFSGVLNLGVTYKF
ncbi:MAG: hypothetical protein EHM58_12260 [Ignavibacteriae bacterium]|nr:MAG: hypothetical protein EHM58_12260 [Ignavibacteriota bacterium]